MLRVKYERLCRGWSQTALAYHAIMSTGDISRIESGRLRPYPSQLEKLAHIFQIDGQALLQEVAEDSVAAVAGSAQGLVQPQEPQPRRLEQHPAAPSEADQ